MLDHGLVGLVGAWSRNNAIFGTWQPLADDYSIAADCTVFDLVVTRRRHRQGVLFIVDLAPGACKGVVRRLVLRQLHRGPVQTGVGVDAGGFV